MSQLGTGHQVDAAVDAAQAEHVLVLEEAAVRPAVDLRGHRVAARPHVARDVELGVVVGPLAVAHLTAVDPQIHGAVYAVEVDEDPLAAPVGRQREVAAVGTHGVGLGVDRVAALRLDEGRVVAERVGDVGVDGRSVAEHLPRRGDADPIPPGDVVGGFVEVGGPLLGALRPVEAPHAVEGHAPRGAVDGPGAQVSLRTVHLLRIGVGGEPGAPGLLVDCVNAFVLPLAGAAVAHRLGRHLEPGGHQAPPLARLRGVGRELEERLAHQPRVGVAEVVARGHGRERVAAVLLRREAPLLIGILRVGVPLDHGALHGPLARVVERALGQRAEELVAPLAAGAELPHLRLAGRVVGRDEEAGARFERLLVVERQTARAQHDVVLARVDRLAVHGAGRERGQRGEKDSDVFHVGRFISAVPIGGRRRRCGAPGRPCCPGCAAARSAPRPARSARSACRPRTYGRRLRGCVGLVADRRRVGRRRQKQVSEVHGSVV